MRLGGFLLSFCPAVPKGFLVVSDEGTVEITRRLYGFKGMVQEQSDLGWCSGGGSGGVFNCIRSVWAATYP
jgi:hypothetical protein